jgi:hypothetical protein
MRYNCISGNKCHIIAFYFVQFNCRTKEEVVNNLNVFILCGFLEVSVRNISGNSSREYSETHIDQRT